MKKILIALSTAFVALLAVAGTSMAADQTRMTADDHKTCGDFGFGTVKDCE